MVNKNEKKYTLNRGKFLAFISILVLIAICIIVIISFYKKIKINDTTDISKLNATKYYAEIKAEYEKDNKKEKFMEDYNKIQEAAGMYILNNSTTDDTSFENLVSKINESMKDNNFKILEIDVSSYWNGNWSIDNKGKVKFKFACKKIEPSWISDEKVSQVIILN